MKRAPRPRALAALILAPSLALARTPAPAGDPASVAAADPAIPAALPGIFIPSGESGARKKPPPFVFGFDKTTGSPTVGVGLADGKTLEMSLWGGGGAMIGSVAGPVGIVVGGLLGAAVGLFVAVVVVPHDGPSRQAPAKKLQ